MMFSHANAGGQTGVAKTTPVKRVASVSGRARRGRARKLKSVRKSAPEIAGLAPHDLSRG